MSEVTDEMVERAARAIWTTWQKHKGSDYSYDEALEAYHQPHEYPKLYDAVSLCKDEARAALFAALSTPLPVETTEWQPIETAPREGTEILGYGSAVRWGRRYAPGRHVCWLDEDGEWRGRDPDDTLSLDLTHWQPLPTAPKGGE